MSRIHNSHPEPEERERVKAKQPEWQPPAFTPPTPEEHEAILRLIAETSAKLGAAKVERAAKRYQATQRCPACDMGKFVHGGVRYCAACYGRL
jgi:hypothetical protein